MILTGYNPNNIILKTLVTKG